MLKKALRRELLAQRNAVSQEQKRRWDEAINRAILAHDWFGQAAQVLGYYPIGSEPDIRPALEEALRQGKEIYLPKCKPLTREMAFHRVRSLEDVEPGAHGIPEPADHCQLSIVHCQLCIVPGLAFDDNGFRLGYGGGYYDRFLARHGELRTLGVCYARASLPRDATDIAVKRVITEGEKT